MYLDREIIPSTLLKSVPGRAGVKATLLLMRDLVRGDKGKKSPVIRQRAVELIKYVPKRDHVGRIRALWAFVRERIAYVGDINGVETVHWPEQIISQRAGDCDDHALLLASLLEAVGIPTRFKAVGFQPGQLDHVYTQAKIGEKWVALETTEPVNMGWEPPNIKSEMIVTNWRS